MASISLLLGALCLIVLISICDGNRTVCGDSGKATGIIVRGNESSRGLWPWLVALYYVKDNEFFCGATLISNRHILTGRTNENYH